VENGFLEGPLMRSSVALAFRRVHVSAFSAWTLVVSSLKPTRIWVDERPALARSKYCRSYAGELRAIAIHVKSPAARQTLLRIANDFDRMADEAEVLAQSRMLLKRPRLNS
jgi:hypothetical protein